MCIHYRIKPTAKDWSKEDMGSLPGLTMPTEMPVHTEHMYPKYLAPVIVQRAGVRTLEAMNWGVVRFIGNGKTKPVTNARNDKLLSRTWKTCADQRRCLIPANGYYEPGLGPTGARGEILVTVKDRPFFLMAGLWENGTFTLVTTEPNELVRTYHDRMPVVLDESEVEAWLGDEPLPENRLAELCRGLPSEALLHETIPPRLKITRLDPKSEPPDAQPSLF